MRRVARTLIGAVGLLGSLGLAGVPSSPAAAEVDIAAADHCRAMAKPVEDLYRAFFLREPDEAGLDYWTRWVSGAEGGILQAAEHFARSPEFVDRYGDLDNEGYVLQLYRNILGREPDPEGLEYWVWALDTEFYSRGAAVMVWTYSAEFHGVGAGESIPSTPLSTKEPGTEWWCGAGRSQLRIERLPLTVAQQIGVAAYDGADLPDWPDGRLAADVTARADDNVIVASSNTSLYLHPNLAAAVLYYQIDILGLITFEGDDRTDEELRAAPWVVWSMADPPPWRQWPAAE